ncbi:MAG TPA: hypothetical protein VE197_10175 [Mycobacterium sp.]|nr:hypothetical protein [Mycobacterium sp.]
MMRRLLVSAALAVWIGASIFDVPSARAVPVVPPNCVEQFWMLGLRASTRRICDGPIRPDGSWHRCRLFYAPGYLVPAQSYCSGGIFSTYCTYYPPQWVPELYRPECYDVTPDTVLSDEPGHIEP